MEHIEEAGIHSGDSACSLPPYSLKASIIVEMEAQTKKMALALNVVGLMNVQFAIKDDLVYVLEVNPRASRTVPFVAKVIGIPVAKIAARVMAGETLASFKLVSKKLSHVAVKEAVFPFSRFPGVDVLLGPEMRSTGEVMGLDKTYDMAFAKSQIGAGMRIPQSGTVFVSVNDPDKPKILPAIRKLVELGFVIKATGGTQHFFESKGIPSTKINKVLEGRPHVVDAIKNGEIQLVLNTTESKASSPTQSPSARPPCCKKCLITPRCRAFCRHQGHRGPKSRYNQRAPASGLFQVTPRFTAAAISSALLSAIRPSGNNLPSSNPIRWSRPSRSASPCSVHLHAS